MKGFFESYLSLHYQDWDANTLGILHDKHADLLKVLQQQIFDSSYGYSKTQILQTPSLQDSLDNTIQSLGLQKKEFVPTICLSHDIDYLKSTLQMNLKKIVAQKKIKWSNETYVESIRKLAEVDQRYGSSTFFICLPEKSSSLIERGKQWILDPSYTADSNEFHELRNILNHKDFEIGIHGSIFSLQNKTLKKEIENIKTAFSKDCVVSSRQHWLNLPHNQSFKVVEEAGIRFDSTLGWNENWGFRGGFCDVFFIPSTNVVEIPLLMMDGTMFDALGLTEDQVVQQASDALKVVMARQGCVSLNWHDRSATEDYGWLGAYERILAAAKGLGFQFSSVEQAMNSRGIQ